MTKTNWNSTWPVIYQSPAAKDAASCLRGDSTPFLFLFFFHWAALWTVPGWGQAEASQRETKRGGQRGSVYFPGRGAENKTELQSCYDNTLSEEVKRSKRETRWEMRKNELSRAAAVLSSRLPSKILIRFLTTIHFDQSPREASG